MKWISGITVVTTLLFSCMAHSQCTINLIAVNFGGYDPIVVTPLAATGYVDVTCNSGELFDIKLGPGQNSGGIFNPRKMQASGSGATLNYNLYRNSTHTEIWGDGTGGTFIQSGMGSDATQQFNIFGLIPGTQNIPAGSYSDIVTVTIEW